MSELDTRDIRRRQQYEMTAAERRGLRHVSPLVSRDVPALCDEVDRLRALLRAQGGSVCPECEQVKHGNCDGMALDAHTDHLVTCVCHAHNHLPRDEWACAVTAAIERVVTT